MTCYLSVRGSSGSGCSLRPGPVDTRDVMSAEASGTFTFFGKHVSDQKNKPQTSSRRSLMEAVRRQTPPPRHIMWTTLLCSRAPPLHGGVCWDVSSLPRAVSRLSRRGGWEGQKKASLCPPQSPLGDCRKFSNVSEEMHRGSVDSRCSVITLKLLQGKFRKYTEKYHLFKFLSVIESLKVHFLKTIFSLFQCRSSHFSVLFLFCFKMHQILEKSQDKLISFGKFR